MIGKIIKSKNSFSWKQEKLCWVIDTLVEQAAQGNFRNIGCVTQSISELNKMDGHHSPTSTININVDQDEYIKRLNDTTMQLIREKREAKLVELKEVSHDRT